MLLRLAGGLTVATALFWMVSRPFLDSTPEYAVDAELNGVTFRPGHTFRFRGEGRGTTRYGRFGIAAIEDVTLVSVPKIAIWGDSMVEAHQVDDALKVAQQVTRISSRYGVGIVGVGVAFSGWSVADYYQRLPTYERRIDPVGHVILVTDPKDLALHPSAFTDSWSPEVPGAALTPARRLTNRWGMPLAWVAFRELITGADGRELRTIRLRPGPVAAPVARVDPVPTPDRVRAAIRALRGRTTRPITIVYAPCVPYIDGGRVVEEPRVPGLADELRTACREEGVGFIDLQPRFLLLYSRTGRFPRGFANSVRSRGHLNQDGHRLVAQAICEYMGERRVAVHTD